MAQVDVGVGRMARLWLMSQLTEDQRQLVEDGETTLEKLVEDDIALLRAARTRLEQSDHDD